jgi:hypothetical protein
VGIVEVVRVSMGGKVESALTSDSGMSNAVDIFGRRSVQMKRHVCSDEENTFCYL